MRSAGSSKLFLRAALSSLLLFFIGTSAAALPAGGIPGSPFDHRSAQFFGEREGELHIRSVPPGATVYLDGRPIGNTVPQEYMKKQDLRPGRDYTLRVVREGYKEHVQTIRFRAGEPTTLTITLEPLAEVPTTGTLAVTSIPADAEVFIDGNYMGRTSPDEPLPLRLPAGAHTLTIHKEGYERYLYRYEVEAGRRQEVRVRLEALPVAPPELPPPPARVAVPNVLNDPHPGAEAKLRQAGLQGRVISHRDTTDRGLRDKVAAQTPLPGAQVARGSTVDLTLYRVAAVAPVSLTALYRGMDQDVVGPGGQATPNGQMDGHFTLTLDTHGARRVVNYILLQSADPQGNPAHGQVWDTQPNAYWILGVYRDNRRLNPTDRDISDVVLGRVTYEVYGNDSGWFRPGQNFRLTVRFTDGGEAVAFAMVGAPPAINLTGIWRANDGGTYYIRQMGHQVFWLGEAGDGGRSWTNIAVGSLSGNQLRLEWGDVTKGRARNSGRLVLRVDGPNHMIRTEGTGGFGGSEWRR